MDLQDREHNTRDGLHIAALAGAWTALVSGFGGMRTCGGGLSFRPRLPPGIAGLSFRLRYRGRVLHVSVRGAQATYSLLSGEPLALTHYGTTVTIGTTGTSLDIPAIPPLPPPSQPAGRVPQSRRERP
jgi:alpha,alpha-trehalose phosphorylase